MDNKFGGPEFASTNRYKFRARNDPRFTDRRMQSLLNAITKELDLFDLNMLADLFYSTIKLRLPEDAIINGCIEYISDRLRKGENIALKNLALVIWSCARIKMPD